MNMTSSGLQCEVAYWPAMTLGGAAQVAAAHWPNERTLDPTVCSYLTDPPMPQPAALWPSPRNVLRQRFASNEYYQILFATHLRTPKGWKAELGVSQLLWGAEDVKCTGVENLAGVQLPQPSQQLAPWQKYTYDSILANCKVQTSDSTRLRRSWSTISREVDISQELQLRAHSTLTLVSGPVRRRW